MKRFKFATSQEAWEGINEWLLLNEKTILKKYGGRYGPEIVAYNVFMEIDNPRVDPKFDFGYTFGYKSQKWNSLLNNYLDRNYLDLVRNEIVTREAKNANSYSYTLHFRNIHTSGKDCLISLTFTRRVTDERPVAIFHVRASEVTKRLLFDFLLVQRVLQFIYGKKWKQVKLEFYCPGCYITAENIAMYNNHRSLKKLLKGVKKKGTFQKRVMTIYKRFKNEKDPSNVPYKVNRRSVMQIQHDEKGWPISGIPSLFAKDLKIVQEREIEYPDDCITEKDRRAHRRKLKKG